MPYNFAVRITKPFSDLSGTVRQWAMKADKMLCYEHDNTDKLHCHLLMLNVSVDAERLKQISKECGVFGKGNEFWSFKTKSKKTGPVDSTTAERYITYMTKGRYDPKYVKGYESEYLSYCKSLWADGDSAPSKQELVYLDFEDNVITYCKARPEDARGILYVLRADKTDVLVSLARRYAFLKASRIWDVRTASLAKSLFLTYAMREDMIIDEKLYKVW